MNVWCYLACAILGTIVLFYCLFEIHYFLRMCWCVVLARYIKKRTHILDATQVTGICLTNDIDTLLYHMNNARYLRELDFARVDFYERTHLYRTILSKGGAVVQGAATVRYRRFIRPFSWFRIESRIIYWDDQSVFMEHRFVSPSDGFVHCVAMCRQRMLDCSANEVMETLLSEGKGEKANPDKLENGDVGKMKPEMPLEVAKWIECNEISSANLRSGC